MAHKVETMAYAGETPWHKLGTKVADNLTPEEMAVEASLNWTLEKLPVYVNFNGEMKTVPHKFNLTRMSDGRVMDVVTDLYKPVQPSQALGFFKRFVEAGHMKLETAGSLDNGRRIWALASIQASFTLAGGDRVEGYLLLCSPNKAGEALTIKFCATRVVCANTIAIALSETVATADGEKTKTVRVNHLQAFGEVRQQQAMEALGIAVGQLERFEESARLLSETKASREAVIQYVAQISGSKILEAAVSKSQAATAPTGSVLDAMIAIDEADKVARTVFIESDLNRVGKSILESITNSPGSEMESAKGTWWGALNGVTHATDHKLGRDNDSRLNSAWYGDRAAMKTSALDLAVEFAMAQQAATN